MTRSRAMRVAGFVMVIAAAVAAAGCDRREPQASRPTPSEVLAEATGYYCGMMLADHEGPKGQIHLASRSEPVWFSSVRDTIAFLRLPEEPRGITAIYVNDMAKAKNWEQPERGAWVDARLAWFVIESEMRGGMGAPEAVPFSDRAAADAFRAANGGRVVRLDEIPDAYVLGPVDLPAGSPPHGDKHQEPT
jgi:copper chaperone NosL